MESLYQHKSKANKNNIFLLKYKQELINAILDNVQSDS